MSPTIEQMIEEAIDARFHELDEKLTKLEEDFKNVQAGYDWAIQLLVMVRHAWVAQYHEESVVLAAVIDFLKKVGRE